MLIYSTTGPLYPITVTELHVPTDGQVERSGKLFTYFYKIVVTETTRYGEEKDILKKVYVPFHSEFEGKIKEWKIAKGTVIKGTGIPIAEVEEPCKHEVQFGGICTECGKDMTEVNYAGSAKDTDRATINMNHRNPALKVSISEAQRVSGEVKTRLVETKKLSLVVDLDQTIIHATVDPTVAEWRSDPDNPNYVAVKDVKSFQLADDGPGVRSCWYHIKSRPGLSEFLQRMATLYELHVYTMGTRAYAEQIMKIVDPERKLFADRVLSRDESGSMSAKDLRRLFPIDDSMVVIIDDRGDVWNWDPHLVKVHGYNFFVGIGDINSSFLPKRPEERIAKKPESPAETENIPATSENGIVTEAPAVVAAVEDLSNGNESHDLPLEDKPTAVEEISMEDAPRKHVSDTAIPARRNSAPNDDMVVDSIADEPTFETDVPKREDLVTSTNGHGEADTTDHKNGDVDKEELAANPELVSGLNKALSKLGTQGDTSLLEEQTHEQDEQIAAQLADRPLLQKQKQLDQLEEAAASRENGTSSPDDSSQSKHRHNLLQDDDTELIYLGENLARIHQEFYDAYEKSLATPLPDTRVAQLRGEAPVKPLLNEDEIVVPNIEALLPQIKQQVLGGTVIVFSGVIPRGVPIRDSEIAIWAASFGAEIHDEISKRTTHVVAARKGTNKIHEARRRRKIKVVTTHWLHDSLTQFKRMTEEDYLLFAPEEKPSLPTDSSAVIFNEQNDVSSTEETGLDGDEDLDSSDLDDIDTSSEATDDNKAVDISEDNWLGIQDELADFLGSEVEDSEAGDSDADADKDTPESKKRKRDPNSAQPSDVEDSDASTKSALGSRLQRRKKRAYERTTSLTKAVTLDEVGLPSPEATVSEEIKENGKVTTIQEQEDEDDGFDEAFREALEETE